MDLGEYTGYYRERCIDKETGSLQSLEQIRIIIFIRNAPFPPDSAAIKQANW